MNRAKLMTNLFCVRADFGTYTEKFVAGGYVAVGWIPAVDLSGITSREQLYPLYRDAHPDDKSNLVIGQQDAIRHWRAVAGDEQTRIDPDHAASEALRALLSDIMA